MKARKKMAGISAALKAAEMPALKSPKILIYLTRWTDRQTHPNYLKTIAQAEEWDGRLIIAYHGSKPLPANEWPDPKSGIDVINFSQLTGGQIFARLVRECLLHGLSQNAGIIGLMDDDAFHASPQSVLGRAQTLIGDRLHGCSGPIIQYRQMARYKDDLPALGFHPINSYPWTTWGCQFYSSAFLSQSLGIWHKHLPALFLRSDAFLFMLAHSLDYSLSEFYIPGYSHRCSKSLAKPGQFDMPSLIRRACISFMDCDGMLAGLPDAYKPEIARIQQEDLKLLRSEFKKLSIPCPFSSWQEMADWGVSLSSDFLYPPREKDIPSLREDLKKEDFKKEDLKKGDLDLSW